jgi:4-hydroxy-L-threonine phosphate dehydrogenase PdxA
MKKKIILIGGDPNSINSELIFKSYKKIKTSLKKRIYLISNFDLIKNQLVKLNYKLKLIKVNNIFEEENNSNLKIINIDLKFKNPFKVSENKSSKFVIKSLKLGHKLALNKNTQGLINCPINKRLLGANSIGVTEFLASMSSIKDNSEVMLIWNKKFSVSPITTHISIKSVSKRITKKLIIKKIKTINQFSKKLFKKKSKIAILGLNPHNSELRKNSEEYKVIIPAIKSLKKLNIKIEGPFAADTVFIKNFKNYDVIVGMFHDQVLVPFKTIFKFNAINITLGLKYLRISPDHGIAANIIGKKKGNADSLIKCFNFFDKY